MNTTPFDPESSLRRWRMERAPEALGELLKHQRDRAYAIALRFTGSPADADDVVQDAFVKLLSRTHGFDDAADFERSVCRAVVQCALDLLKQRRRRRERFETGASGGVNEVAASDPRTPEVEREDLRAALRAAVQDLHEDERAPVVLCGQQGLSVSDAARVLELPRETVRARLKRGLADLRARLLRADPRASPALLPLLLWEEGRATAPEELCRALDAALPGCPCAQVAARARPSGPEAGSGFGAKAALGVAAAGLAAAVLLLSIGSGAPAPLAGARPSATNGVKREAVQEEAPPGSMSRAAETQKEEVQMNRTLGAVVLAGVLSAPLAANATEPSSEVAKVVKEIEARKAEKAAAQAKAVKEYSKSEAGERGWVRVAPGANPQPNRAKVGQ